MVIIMTKKAKKIDLAKIDLAKVPESKQVSLEPAWIKEVELETAIADFGLEVVNGVRYDLGIDITQPPQQQEESFEGAVTVKWIFNVKLIDTEVVEPLDMQLLKRDNPKKHGRVLALKLGKHKLKLTRSQTNQFIKFLKAEQHNITDKTDAFVSMQRFGQSFKTKYSFELVPAGGTLMDEQVHRRRQYEVDPEDEGDMLT